MLKKVSIVIIIILIIIVSGDIITQNYTEETVDVSSKMLLNLKEQIKIDRENAKKELEIFEEYWNKRYNILTYYIEHDELEKVWVEVHAIKSNIETEDYKNGDEDIDKCIFLLNHIKDKEAFTVRNIF